jgi:hypothetical protein
MSDSRISDYPEVYPRLLTVGILQRGMLARLAAHINAGQMAAVGLGVGGEGAIVIDDNCTVSMLSRNCHRSLLTREPRLCELGFEIVMTARPTRMTYQTKETGRARGNRCGGNQASLGVQKSPTPKLSFLLSALWASFA